MVLMNIRQLDTKNLHAGPEGFGKTEVVNFTRVCKPDRSENLQMSAKAGTEEA